VFVGTFEHTLDDKGRLVLPPSFRGRLTDGGYVTPYENCLAIWTYEGFQGFSDRLGAKVRSAEAPNNSLRLFLAAASEVKPDAQGRITLPPRLRDMTGLASEAVLTGAGDHIEIWTQPAWNAVADTAPGDLTEAIGRLGLFS
jgi:MraZ protein